MDLSGRLLELRRRVQGTPRSDEHERLVQLFRNRVELKKEMTRLQDENFHLLQHIKKYEAERQTHQQQMTQLETFLGIPANGLTGLVFYQLRALWQLSSRRLAELGEELTTQQRERERRLQVMEFDQKRQRRLAELEAQSLDAQSKYEAVDARVQLVQRRLSDLRWFWQFRQRRELRESLQPLLAERAEARGTLQALQEERQAMEVALCPDFVGLSVEGKRLVNTAVIAYAQQLLERLGGEGLLGLAKDAAQRQVTEVTYGADEDCRAWLDKLRITLTQLHQAPRDLQHLRTTIQRLRGNVFYRSDHDTVPVPETTGTVNIRTATGAKGQAAMAEEVNVLLEDSFGLYSVLLH